MQVISAAALQWIFPFAGLKPTRFRRLVRLVAQRGGDQIADGRPGRPWALPLPNRVLMVAASWRTKLTLRQISPLFGAFYPAAQRVIDAIGPLLAQRRARDQIAIVDGALIQTRDHTLAAPSKNYRYSTNLQVAINADTRVVIALDDPQPGNRNDTIGYQTRGIKTASPDDLSWPTAVGLPPPSPRLRDHRGRDRVCTTSTGRLTKHDPAGCTNPAELRDSL